MRIDCISDLHGYFPQLDGGDLLIVAGDLTAHDKPREYKEVFEWLNDLQYKQIIVIAGNHDMHLEQLKYNPFFILGDRITYICDSGTEFKGLKIWGIPWSLTFYGINPNCTAFTGDELYIEWVCLQIPDDTEILISHGPPYGILDGIPQEDGSEYHCGSHSLLAKIGKLPHLKIVIFGHIHEHGGKMVKIDGVKYINASVVDERYRYVNKPITIEL